MMRRHISRECLVLLLLAMTVLNVSVFGQGFTSSVLGTVTDTSGAIISQAAVTVTNRSTGTTTKTVTDSGGHYTVPELPPGDYSVTVESPGFKTATRTPVSLQVDERQPIDFKLEIGAVSQSVTVMESAVQLQTATATVGTTVTATQTTELPLNGRNFIQLNLLVPGAAPEVKGSNLSSQGGSIQVHGLPENQNYFWLNGVDNTTDTIGQYVVNIPAFSIQEFRVMSPTYDAEFGRTPGAQVNLISRSGGSSYHGDAYGFLRNSAFDAKNYFSLRGNIPAFRRLQYGADLGGPILKNKLFFYGAVEILTYAQGESAANVVPSSQEIQGNFSDLAKPIKDPMTGLPFPMNIIPPGRINSTGAAYAAFYPAPNVPGTNTAIVSPTGTDGDNVFLGKLDEVFSDKDRASLHFALEDLNYHEPIAQFSSITNIPGFGIDQRGAKDIATGLDETHIFSPNLLMESRAGWNHYQFQYYPQAGYQDWCALLLIQGCDEGPANWDVPEASVTGYSTLGAGTAQTQYGFFNTLFVDPTLTWIKGRHTAKFGWDYHYYYTSSTNGQSPRGSFTFNGAWTGNAFADLLLGLPYQASKTVIADEPNNVFYYMHFNQTAAFAQDDFRMNPRLTLNFGIRYELNLPAVEEHDHQANLNVTNGVANAVLQIPGQNGVGNSVYTTDYHEIAPRFGFSYTPQQKWVIRGGYGVFYQMILESSPRQLHNNPPFQNTYTIVGDGKEITINNALVNGIVANVPAVSAYSQYMKAGMVQQFSANVQHQLLSSLTFEVGYVGTLGRDINNNVPINTPPPGPGAVQARRANIHYAGINLYSPSTTSRYNGLELRLDERISRNMQFLVSYTRSSSYDNTGTPQDPRNLRAQWGPSTYDIPNHLSFSYVYHLPFGREAEFLNNMNRLEDAFLGGWQLNGIFQSYSGQPFTPILPIDNTNTQENSDRPNLIGNPFASTPTCKTKTPTCWANAAAFATPPAYTFGNAGTDEVRGPGFNELDFAVAKNLAVGESKHVELRAEAFNIFNHPNFDIPNATLSSSFGTITSAEAAREIQFGLRFVF
jgi:hypothetical protein